jgi:hypothetical protein
VRDEKGENMVVVTWKMEGVSDTTTAEALAMYNIVLLAKDYYFRFSV